MVVKVKTKSWDWKNILKEMTFHLPHLHHNVLIIQAASRNYLHFSLQLLAKQQLFMMLLTAKKVPQNQSIVGEKEITSLPVSPLKQCNNNNLENSHAIIPYRRLFVLVFISGISPNTNPSLFFILEVIFICSSFRYSPHRQTLSCLFSKRSF